MEQSKIDKYFPTFKKGFNKTSLFIKSGISKLTTSSQRSFEEELENFEKILIESDLGVDISMDIINELRKRGTKQTKDEISAFIEKKLLGEFRQYERDFVDKEKPQVILFAGINGSGKTTSISKIGHILKQRGYKILFAAGDTFRAAAVEQLSIWADRLEVPIIKHKMGADPAAVAHDACESAKAKKIDYVLIDTAGRLHSQNPLMEELKKIVRVINARVGANSLEKLLVIDGNAGQNSYMQAKTFKEAIGIDGIIITKLDGTAKGGVVVSVEKELSIPVKFIGVGEKLDDLLPFSPDTFVKALIEG